MLEIDIINNDTPKVEELGVKIFSDLPQIRTFYQNLTALQHLDQYQALVSPGNSFGQMDGGIDGAIVKILPGVDHQVQQKIFEDYYGEQPVGTAFVIKTKGDIPYLIHAPTMRLPSRIQEVYDSYRAMFREIRKFNQTSNKITKILCTTHGTGTGKLSLEQSLRELKLAYTNTFSPEYPSWESARKVQAQLTKAQS